MARHVVTFADLVACARRVGVKVIEAPSSHRGQVGEMGTVLGTTLHWTGTPLSFNPSADYPDYNVVKEGRAGLDNSLSAYGLGRREAIYVFSEDLSYHAGVWSYGGTTDGNGHFLGVEAAGAGEWTAWQREVYPRLIAAVHLFIEAPVSMAPTHAMGAMPRGRKSDISLDGRWAPSLPGGPRTFHDTVAWLMNNPAYININYQGDDMPLTDTDVKKVVDELLARRLDVNVLDERDDEQIRRASVKDVLELLAFQVSGGAAGFRPHGPLRIALNDAADEDNQPGGV